MRFGELDAKNKTKKDNRKKHGKPVEASVHSMHCVIRWTTEGDITSISH